MEEEEEEQQQQDSSSWPSSIGEDDIQLNILSRLSASSFASASCVNRSFNRLCNQILSKPKLLSAYYINPSLEVAVEESLDKQIDWKLLYAADRGVVLIVGFMPGMTITTIPFFPPIEEHIEAPLMDKFVEEIEEYTSSVSGCTSPTGIIMFTDHFYHLQPLLDKMDYALSSETVIVGGKGGSFLCNNGVDSSIIGGYEHFEEYRNAKRVTVAVVFATDKNKSHGRIHFNLAIANGLSPIGPIFQGASVKVINYDRDFLSSLTGRIEGSHEILGGDGMFRHVENQREEVNFPVFIGVTKRRTCSIKSSKPELISSLSFYKVNEITEKYLWLRLGKISTGDKFRFYHPFRETAQLAHSEVYEELRTLKQLKVNGEEVVFGGLMFASSGRDLLVGGYDVCSSAFLENFPGVPLARMFCSGEIGRGNSMSTKQDKNDKNDIRSSLHVYSTVYLVMSYTPNPLED